MIKAILSSPLPHDRTTIKGIVISLCIDDGAVGKERTAMNKRIQLRESFHNSHSALLTPPPFIFIFKCQMIIIMHVFIFVIVLAYLFLFILRAHNL